MSTGVAAKLVSGLSKGFPLNEPTVLREGASSRCVALSPALWLRRRHKFDQESMKMSCLSGTQKTETSKTSSATAAAEAAAVAEAPSEMLSTTTPVVNTSIL